MRKSNLEQLAHFAVDPHAEVEMLHITDYLKSKGYSLEKLAELPEEEIKVLLEGASQYASLRLAELELGAAFVSALHHDSTRTTDAGASLSAVDEVA
jgi:hypothetical protein